MQNYNYQELVNILLLWLFFIVLCEALTKLARHAEPLEGIRAFLSRKSKFMAALLSCGYCTSVWIAFAFAWMLPPIMPKYESFGPFYLIIAAFMNNYMWWFLNGVILHRLSNMWHDRVMTNSFSIIDAPIQDNGGKNAN